MRRLVLALLLLSFTSTALARGRGREPLEVAASPETLFFSRYTWSGLQLWRTDGTAEGTWQIDTGTTHQIKELTLLNGMVYYLGEESWKPRLYVSDSSRAPAEVFAKLDGVEAWGFGTNGSHLFFFTQTELIKSCLRMWKSDGTREGTRVFNVLLTDEARSVAAAGSRMLVEYYPIQPFEWRGRKNYDLWSSDGSVEGTGPLLDRVPEDLRPFRDLVLFGETPLMRSDGTIAGTFPIAENARVVGISGDTAFFSERTAVGGEYALWKTDGTLTGTVRIGSLPFLPFAAGVAGGRIFAIDRVGREVWEVEASGMRRKVASLGISPYYPITYAFQATGALFLTDGRTLWRTDGTEDGTVDLGSVRAHPPFHEVGGRVVFFADDGVHGFEPWVSDGTAAGTRMIANLELEGTIRGRVTDLATGAPLTNVVIEALEQYSRSSYSVPVDEDGRYVLEGVSDSTFIRARSGDNHLSQWWGADPCSKCNQNGKAIYVAPGTVRDGVDFALPIGGTIAGRVRAADGKPIAGATVTFVDIFFVAPFATAKTRADGTYTTDPLIPDRPLIAYVDAAYTGYSKAVYDGITCSAGCDVSSPYTRVSAPAGGTRDGVDFTLYPYARIRGRILDAVTGRPITTPVILQGWRGWTIDSQVQISARSKPDGTYELVMPDGRYWIKASQVPPWPFSSPWIDYDPTWYPDVSCSDCISPRGTEIVPKPGEVIEHDFLLKPRAPRVGGTVTDAQTGRPLPNVTVDVLLLSGVPLFSVRTGEDGTYETPPRLGAAEFWVRVQATNEYHGASLGPVRLSGNERRIVDIQLQRVTPLVR